MAAALTLTALGAFAGGMYCRSLWTDAQAAESFAELSKLVVLRTPAPGSGTPAPTVALQIPAPAGGEVPIEITATPAPTETLAPAPTETPAPAVSVRYDYEALYALNPDFFGWITLAGTRVDYPVMFSPDRPRQYLSHDFYGKASHAGVPYLFSECDPAGKYLIVYGHHMKDGSMFAGLMAYEDRAFWQQHPTFRFDTRSEQRTYAVVAAFRARVLTVTEQGFRYYNYTALDDEETFRTYMSSVRAMAAYDTGVETAFGDEILTLSTCAYHTEKGRFVVVGKRID